MKIKYFTLSLMAAFGISASTFLTSCEDTLEIAGNTDESEYENIYENSVSLKDSKSNLGSTVLEMYGDTYTASLKVEFSKESQASTVIIKIDNDYLANYNQQHGTDYELFPAKLVSLNNDGVINIAEGQKKAELDFTLHTSNELKDNTTYALPLTVEFANESRSVDSTPKAHCLYLVKNLSNLSNCFKGEDKVKGYLFFEVNDVNPLNALSFELENGKLLWDVVVLFAANINIDSSTGRPRVQCNPNVQYLLDNNETLLQPLRKRGIKVLLGILGNHDAAGVAQLSKSGAKDFANELAQYCKAYHLDGVNFDDEYSDSPDLSNPALTNKSTSAAARLCYETKQAMPDKLVTVFAYGSMYGVDNVDGVDAKEWIDIAVPNYGSIAYPIGAMTKKQCAGAAIEFNLGYGSLSQYASRLKSDGFGWFMCFAPSPKKFNDNFGRLYQGCKVLYDCNLKAPTVFYKKNDPKPYNYPADL